MENNIQVGCQFNRLDRYNKELVDGFYQLDGICPYIRNIYSDAAKQDNPIEYTKKESEIKYSVILELNENIKEIRETLASISKFPPLNCVIYYSNNESYDIMSLHRELSNVFERVVISYSIDNDTSIFDPIEEAVSKTKADYLYFCDPGHVIQTKCIEYLNSLINDELKSVYIIIGNNFTIINKRLFEKFSHLKEPIISITKSLLNSEKLKDTVYKWTE
jgi:hypothetical protein